MQGVLVSIVTTVRMTMGNNGEMNNSSKFAAQRYVLPAGEIAADRRFEVVDGSGNRVPTHLAHPHLIAPSVPQMLLAPIDVFLLSTDAVTRDPPTTNCFKRSMKGSGGEVPIRDRVGWACRERDPHDSEIDDFLGVNATDCVNFVMELGDLEDGGYITSDEWQNQAPQILNRKRLMSAKSRAVFAELVRRRREVAETRATMIVESSKTNNVSDSGFTLIHVATGISASFYVDDCLGKVMAKSYSNPFRPECLEDVTPFRFLGYGVGRRLYRAAHDLWPQIRWEDNANRLTSKALRRSLHQEDPYAWQDKTCPQCSLCWQSSARSALQNLHC